MSNVMYLVRKPVGQPYQVYTVDQCELKSARVMGRSEIAPTYAKRTPRVWRGVRANVVASVHTSPELATQLIEAYKMRW